MAVSLNQKYDSLLDMDLNTEEIDEINRDIIQINQQSLLDYAKHKATELSAFLARHVSQLEKIRTDKKRLVSEYAMTNSQKTKQIREKQEAIETPPQAEFVQFLATFLSYMKNLTLMVGESKTLSKPVKIKLEAALAFMSKHLGQAYGEQRWIFKETEAVYTFLREYFNLLNDIKTKLVLLNEQGNGLCCSSSAKKDLETKVGILEHKLFAFPILFNLEARKLIKISIFDEKGSVEIPELDLKASDLSAQIEGILIKDFPELNALYKLKTQNVFEKVPDFKEHKLQAAPVVVDDFQTTTNTLRPSKTSLAKELLFSFSGAPNHSKALRLLLEADQEGCKEASLYIGKIYAEGQGVRKNLEKAYFYLNKAHSYGNTEGTYQLGRLIENSPSQSEDKTKSLSAALELYEQAARSNHSDALTDIGFINEKGFQNNQKDLKKAETCYQQAIDLGNPRAMNNLASLYLNNQKDNISPQQARKIFELFDRSAKCGYPVALSNLGICYFKGIHVGQDYIAARQLFNEACELNDVDGIFYSAFFILKESTLNVSDEKYTLAAKQLHKVLAINENHCDALYYLGYLYENGLGVAQDYKTAHNYYLKSVKESNNTDAKAMYKLANLYYTGKGCGQQNKQKALELYLKASNLGDPDALYVLGVIHDEGIDVQQNRQLAKEFFAKSAQLGNSEAQTTLSRFTIN